MKWGPQRPTRPEPVGSSKSLALRHVPLTALEPLIREGVIWALIDACDNPSVPSKVYELGGRRAVSLLRGEAETEYAEIAPYLVHVDEFVLQWMVESFWQDPWGILAVARGDLGKLRTHFRKFLTVEDPDGKKMYFRYYDPRILQAFLPACQDEEIHQIFGPVDALGIGDSKGESASFFSHVQSDLPW